jgi:hypothetical protein
MRDVQNNEAAHYFGITASYCPGDCAAPIMADEMQRLAAQVFVERDHVGDEFVERIPLNASRFVALIVAATVRCDDVISDCRERTDLVTPPVPELRKPVEKDNLCAVCVTGFRGMQLNRSVPEMKVPDQCVREQVLL